MLELHKICDVTFGNIQIFWTSEYDNNVHNKRDSKARWGPLMCFANISLYALVPDRWQQLIGTSPWKFRLIKSSTELDLRTMPSSPKRMVSDFKKCDYENSKLSRTVYIQSKEGDLTMHRKSLRYDLVWNYFWIQFTEFRKGSWMQYLKLNLEFIYFFCFSSVAKPCPLE